MTTLPKNCSQKDKGLYLSVFTNRKMVPYESTSFLSFQGICISRLGKLMADHYPQPDMKNSRVAICIKLKPEVAEELRAASSFLRGFPFLLTLQDICEAAIETELERLRTEHGASLKVYNGKFPVSRPVRKY